jgi:FkbM family methyltransferase
MRDSYDRTINRPTQPGDSTIRSLLQSFLIGLYRHVHGAVQSTALGRAALERAYIAYKLTIEAGPIDRLSGFIRPGAWAIDVGANIGVFTLSFARAAKQDGKVIAIEPEEANFAALKRRAGAAGLTDRVVARRAVAAERAGELLLEINPHHPGDHKIGSTGIAVPALTLDGLLAELGTPPVSLIKIDVQGAELRVLQGAVDLLARDRPALFVEIDDAMLRRQGASAEELMTWLRSRGYRSYRLDWDGPPVPMSLTGMSAETGYIDVLFLHADSGGAASAVRA